MGLLLMSDKERLYKSILDLVKNKSITLRLASAQCGVSYRQTLRLYQRYLNEGDAGLVHKSRGCQSNKRNPKREAIIRRYKERYEGFGPTLAAEKLAEEDHLFVNHETLRKWLLKENIWNKQRERSPYRRRRERRAQFGELVQIDGSIHDWLSEGKHTCLLNIVDDATGKTLSHLDSGETTRSVFIALKKWIELYGVPLSIYVDLKNVYVSSKKINVRMTMSYVERACHKLGIKIIKAYSPQAKGRVERNHGVYQDRFVKELHLKGVKTIAEANKILDSYFIDQLNKKFEKSANNPISAHRPVNQLDLEQILCWEDRRTLLNDWTFSYRGNYFQIEKPFSNNVRPKSIIKIRKHLDGSMSYWHNKEKLTVIRLPSKTKQGFINPYPQIISNQHQITSIKTSWGKANRDFFRKYG